ncbi:HesB/YadR/YfhF family protein [Bacillus sp. ISL-40]|uniref:HesB/YadR/YfhF family protein n=1 Tax=unclassified Bacillus (in: firmicutes) TaxID=185979 RepID=UPI001BE51E6F|nr:MULTISPECIES: HesB/YadR/YfhF family protein [unclassified Bacillus (in: firmicutes)]MBT2697870.1 HesB/YadR/YfhF family protein [Bacillus sp. ISL-40]MBT2721541.1 HesB/YadR/YfhF family protein [Bacillus sp. ISL-46]
MEIVISKTALKWFKDEVELKTGDKVKFYPKVYGNSPVQEGFSLGFTVDNEPIDMITKFESEGMWFYVEERDLWFFNGHDLQVNYNEKTDELEYSYTKSAE